MYSVIINLVESILTLIAPFLPAAYLYWKSNGFEIEYYYWMGGFAYGTARGYGVTYIEASYRPEPCGYICGIIIIISALISIIININILKSMNYDITYPFQKGAKLILLVGIIAIASMIVWIFYIDFILVVFFFIFSYAVYILFIGAGITIIGSIITLNFSSRPQLGTFDDYQSKKEIIKKK